MKDAKRKRRQYLASKAHKIVGTGMFAGAAAFALAAACVSLLLRQSGPWLTTWAYTAATLLCAGAICCYMTCRTANEAKSIPYVPPVAEQIAALPAEEILVRGSEQPAAPSGELLRAARAGIDTEPTELLRADLRGSTFP